MKINADFQKRVVVHSAEQEWLSSPMAGVLRRPLDRVGEEVARATSIVRYDPNSHFSPHVHTGGEEFLVLAGVFQDEHGDFPIGSYIRNPPTSRHQPGSKQGCVILVKLWQFELADRIHVRLNANFMQPVPHRDYSGARIIPLYRDAVENVYIVELDPNADFLPHQGGGAELFVIEGEVAEGRDTLKEHSWLRVPEKAQFKIKAGPTGAKLWIKQGHLVRANAEIERLPSA